MRKPLVMVVSLWLRNDDAAEFESFERRAAEIMKRHGGAIDRAVRIDDSPRSDEIPFEIHVVRFPDRDAFERYRLDPDTIFLAETRERIIARTMILSGEMIEY